MEQLSCKNLSYKRNKFSIQIPHLSIRKSEKISLLGENGSGKSTFLHLLAGIISGDGDIEINESSLHLMNHREKSAKTSLLPQEAGLIFNLTVRDLLELDITSGTRISSLESDSILKITGLTPLLDQNYHTLSGGEKRRAMLARVMLRQTPILLLDEPTAPLDLRFAHNITSYLAKRDQTVIMAMHDLNLAIKYFDRFLLMKNGRILYDRTKDELSTDELEDIYEINLQCHNGYYIPNI